MHLVGLRASHQGHSTSEYLPPVNNKLERTQVIMEMLH